MKFKVEPYSDTFYAMDRLYQKIKSVKEEIAEAAKGFGGTGAYITESGYVAGGLAGIQMEAKPEGWRVVSKQYPDYFFPRRIKQNTLLLDAIKRLPAVDADEINEIVGFNPQFVGLAYCKRPGIKFHFDKGIFLIDIYSGCQFTPNADMTEILESEFIKLQNEAEAKEPA